MWYVVEVGWSGTKRVLEAETALWGPFPGHEHAHRWVQGRQATDEPGLHRYTIRPLFRAD